MTDPEAIVSGVLYDRIQAHPRMDGIEAHRGASR